MISSIFIENKNLVPLTLAPKIISGLRFLIPNPKIPYSYQYCNFVYNEAEIPS